MRLSLLAGSVVLSLVAPVCPARAELVFFAGGRAMSVKGHRADGDRLVLLLRNGGELACDASQVARIEPDEVPHPEPAVALTMDGASDARLTGDTTSAAAVDAVVEKVAREQGVSPRLVRAVIMVESGGQPAARSVKGAVGLMQVMPATARMYTTKSPYDPVANIEAGIRHLRALLDRFPLTLALAAYNAGEAAVQRYGGVPPYPETRRYVSQILRLLAR